MKAAAQSGSNPIYNTVIACRTTKDFLDKVQAYAESNDLTVSQLIRKGLKQVIKEYQAPKKNWSVSP
jgi:antitoxin component of RelBE/YafQ-DinJ toxin-antitoxin module